MMVSFYNMANIPYMEGKGGVPFAATNALGPLAAFAARRHYKRVTDHLFSKLPNTIDLWYNTPYYGRVNALGQLVAPRQNFLTYSMSDSFIALDFVFDAFQDFRTFLERAMTHERTGLSTLLGRVVPQKGYTDPIVKYSAYALSIVYHFNAYIINSSAILTTPDHYIKEFVKFLSTIREDFTFSSYYASSKTAINSTGLAIDLHDWDRSDDTKKNEVFDHPEFYRYVQVAANFGFRVSQHAPTTLIADLKSKPMAIYMAQYGIGSVDTLFASHFETAASLDFQLAVALLYEGYQQYQYQQEFGVDTIHCVEVGTLFRCALSVNITSTQYKLDIEEVPKNKFVEKYLHHNYIAPYIEQIKYLEFTKDGRRPPNYNSFKKMYQIAVNAEVGTFSGGSLFGDASPSTTQMLIQKYYNNAAIYQSKSSKIPHYFQKGARQPTSSKNLLTFKEGLSTLYPTQVGGTANSSY
jgi:hypothetical protein